MSTEKLNEISSGSDQPVIDEDKVSAKDKMLILTIIIIIAILAIMAVAGFLFIRQEPDTIQGQGEATEVRISGKLPGRVAEIYVEEGQHVTAGDTLVRIHSSLVDARMDQAKAMEQVASAGEQKVDAGTRVQVVEAAADMVAQAKAAVDITQKTYERMNNLYSEGVVTEQKRDEAKAAYDAAVAAHSAAKSQYELAKSGAQKEDKQAASAMVKASKAGVKEVGAILEDQYLTAPYDGVITVIYPNVSELVALGTPIMTLQRDDHWATFNVRETKLKDIKNGSVVKVYIPALDLNTEMTVYYIMDLGTYANWQATKSTGDFDARTFKVKMRPKKAIENFRPGMSVIWKE